MVGTPVYFNVVVNAHKMIFYYCIPTKTNLYPRIKLFKIYIIAAITVNRRLRTMTSPF